MKFLNLQILLTNFNMRMHFKQILKWLIFSQWLKNTIQYFFLIIAIYCHLHLWSISFGDQQAAGQITNNEEKYMRVLHLSQSDLFQTDPFFRLSQQISSVMFEKLESFFPNVTRPRLKGQNVRREIETNGTAAPRGSISDYVTWLRSFRSLYHFYLSPNDRMVTFRITWIVQDRN